MAQESQWTQQKDEKLLDLIGKGLEFKEICTLLNTTENACIGRAYRICDEKRQEHRMREEQKHDALRTIFPPRGFCVWITNNPNNEEKAHFCGLPIADSREPYCADHKDKAYRKGLYYEEVFGRNIKIRTV